MKNKITALSLELTPRSTPNVEKRPDADEFAPDPRVDSPAIVFYGCPSAGAEALINAFRSLADGAETEVALHQLDSLTALGNVQVFAISAKSSAGLKQASACVFRWVRDREGWLEVAELAEAVAHSDPSRGTRFQYLESNGAVKVIFSTNRAW